MGVRRVVVTVVLVAALVSCSEEDPRSEPADPTSSPTVTTSQEPRVPEPPALPAVAREPTKAGAVALLRYYWHVVDYAQETGDVAPLKALGLPQCEFCTGGIRYLEGVSSKGGIVRSAPHELQLTRAQLGTAGGRRIASIAGTVRSPASVEYFGKKDPRNRRFAASSDDLQFLLRWSSASQSWQVATVVPS